MTSAVRNALAQAISVVVWAIVDAPFVGDSSGGFDPADLFGAGDAGGVFDIERMDLCYQDLNGTVPVTALGQIVLSIRAVNRPSFLIKFNSAFDPVACVYARDPQGYAYLHDTNLAPTASWTVYGMEDVGEPVSIGEYTCVLSSIGLYESNNDTLGAGSTVVGDTTGAQTPYSYSGVYAVDDGGGAFDVYGSITIDGAPLVAPFLGETLDDRPFVFAVRVRDGEQTMQINLEPEVLGVGVQALFPAPVGMRIWVGARGGWYGGVIISRWLDDTELLDTQNWSAALPGINLSPVVFHPLDLILPGDVGGLYDPNIITSLFQTRTGPTVPVTADGQPVHYIVNQAGQLDLARPTTASGFTFDNGGIVGIASNTLSSALTTTPVGAMDAVTVVASGYVDVVAMRTGDNNVIESFGPFSVTAGINVSVTIGAVNNRVAAADAGTTIGAIPAVPDAQFATPYVVGGVYDYVGLTQTTFFNDIEVTQDIAVAPATTGVRMGTGVFASGAAATYWSGPTFFVNRKLNVVELANLKAWMRANTPTP